MAAMEIAVDEAQAQEMNTIIVRLPSYMREANRGLFEPRVLSIGPYHRGKGSTVDMEAHKECFFERQGNKSREYYLQDITDTCFAQAVQCYRGNIGEYTAEMLTRDGCFILELLLRWKEWNSGRRPATADDNYVQSMWNSIYYDLLLFDNQIPFFVLNRIFHVFMLINHKNSALRNIQLLQLVKEFFNHKGQFSWARADHLLDQPDVTHVCHLLDFQYKLVISNNTANNPSTPSGCLFRRLFCNICRRRPPSSSSMPRGIPGAKELQVYGVRFRVNEDEQAKMFDVKFEGEFMRIPRFQINFGSKILLANLFAYDQIAHRPGVQVSVHLQGHRVTGQQQAGDQVPGGELQDDRGVVVGAVTSYVVLMNALINKADDVVVLQREGILDNLLSDEEEVASFFNKLGRCTLVDVSEHRYTSMFDDVNWYWMDTYNCCKYLAIFNLIHCRTPLTFLSLLGALLLLSISFTSMIFAILKYKRG